MRLAPRLVVCLLVGAAFLQGCARLPPRPDLPEDLALPVTTGTKLDTAIAPLQDAHPGESGFRIVSDGVEAFALRGFSARAAGRSLDVQYYIWHNDLTGRLLARELLSAADRGVKVRLLLDDLDARTYNFALAGLEAHPNISVRLFNPFASRGGSLRKLGEMATGLARLNHRMHNKTWIADNRIAIAGGRNIGDEYFAASDAVNFLDTDFAVLGPAVQEVSTSFDEYWNSAAVWPMSSLSPELIDDAALAKLRKAADKVALEASQSAYVQSMMGADTVQRVASGETVFHWTPRWQMLADDPLKALGDKEPAKRSHVARGLATEIRAASDSVILITPYFVPGVGGTALLVDEVKKGRKVSVLTNSLAANDVAAVHGGYASYRRALLDGGVLIWELKPDAEQKGKGSIFGSSGASLHSKSALIDDDTIFIGSFNVDPRSVSLNCEMGILATHPALAAELATLYARITAPDRAWRVYHDESHKLRWSDGTRTYKHEPEASFMRRVTARLFRILPFDSQL